MVILVVMVVGPSLWGWPGLLVCTAVVVGLGGAFVVPVTGQTVVYRGIVSVVT